MLTVLKKDFYSEKRFLNEKRLLIKYFFSITILTVNKDDCVYLVLHCTIVKKDLEVYEKSFC